MQNTYILSLVITSVYPTDSVFVHNCKNHFSVLLTKICQLTLSVFIVLFVFNIKLVLEDFFFSVVSLCSKVFITKFYTPLLNFALDDSIWHAD